MGKLSSAIVQRRLASLRDVEEALARQVLYGGDLATNLLEQSPTVSEQSLSDLLAETQGLPAAPFGEIPSALPGALQLVPGDVALRHGIYPLEQGEGTLIVAVSEALKPDVEQDLGFGLGVSIVQRVAPLVRIRQAISRDYGLPLDRRSQRVLAKIEGRPDPNPSLMPAPLSSSSDITSLPRPPSIPPLGLPLPTDMTPLYAETAEAPRAARATTHTEPSPAMDPAVDEIHSVSSMEETSIHDLVTARAPNVAIPPDVVITEAPSSRSLKAAGDFAAWNERIKGPTGRRSRRRGPYTSQAAERDILAAEVRDDVLVAFFDFCSQYFEYSALFAIHGDLAEGRDAAGPGADRSDVMGIGVPLDLPGALASVRDTNQWTFATLTGSGIDEQLAKDLRRTSGKRALVLPVVVRRRAVLIFYGDDGENDVDLSEIGDVLAFAPLAATALENVILRKKGITRDDSKTASRAPMRSSSRASREDRAEALAHALETQLRPSSVPPAPPISRRVTVPGMAAVQYESPLVNAPEPEVHEVAIPLDVLKKKSPPVLPDESPDLTVGLVEAGVDWPTDAARASERPESQVVVAIQVPQKRHSSSELRLPTVILNLDDDAEGLARRLAAGDESVLERLTAMGARAAAVLVAKFPGPVKSDSNELGAFPLASQQGPVLRALARIGGPAVPFIAVRSNDADAEVRAWATRLLGEIPTIEAAQAVARRVIDAYPDVRRAALEAGRLLQAHEDAKNTLVDRIGIAAEDKALSVESRHEALEALAYFREPRSVYRLARLATEPDEIGKSAQWALGVITRQTFGDDGAAWEAWWSDNRDRHRIEWLIDALMHEDVEVRRAAGEELKTLTKEYFGYYDDLTKGERAKAQKRYRQWWETVGKGRFSK
jgi:hypothetical protein